MCDTAGFCLTPGLTVEQCVSERIACSTSSSFPLFLIYLLGILPDAAMEDETCPQRLWGRPHEEETLPPVQLVTLRPRSGCSGAVSPRAVSLLEIPCRPHHRRHRNAQRPHRQPLSPPRGNEDMAGDETQGDTAGEGTEDVVTIFLIHGGRCRTLRSAPGQSLVLHVFPCHLSSSLPFLEKEQHGVHPVV